MNAERFFRRSIDQVASRQPQVREVLAIIASLAPEPFPIAWIAESLEIEPSQANTILASLADFCLLHRAGIGPALRYQVAHAYVHSLSRILPSSAKTADRLESALVQHITSLVGELRVPYSPAQEQLSTLLPHLRQFVEQQAVEEFVIGERIVRNLIDLGSTVLPDHAALALQHGVFDILRSYFANRLQSDPSNSEWQRDLVVSELRLATIALKAELPETAALHFGKCLTILKTLRGRGVHFDPQMEAVYDELIKMVE
jgi:hypothetical protein